MLGRGWGWASHKGTCLAHRVLQIPPETRGRVSTRPGVSEGGDTAPEVLNPSPGRGQELGGQMWGRGGGGSADMESLVSSIQIFQLLEEGLAPTGCSTKNHSFHQPHCLLCQGAEVLVFLSLSLPTSGRVSWPPDPKGRPEIKCPCHRPHILQAHSLVWVSLPSPGKWVQPCS